MDEINDDKKLVYHYCSVETLYSMLSHKKLWLSDANYMNDTYETIWIDKIVNDVLEKLKEKKRENVEKYRSFFDNVSKKKHFLMCFSKCGDLLSQWRGYGNDAKGVSIGFNFNDIFYPKSPFAANRESFTAQIGYQDVDYGGKSSTKDIEETINSKDQDIETSAVFHKELDTIIKHSYFSEEQEVRLVYTPENRMQNGSDTPTKFISKETFFRPKNDQLIPYYEFDFSSYPNLVEEIIIGSKSPLQIEDLKFFLSKSGFEKIKVSRSSAPYK